MPLQKYTFDEKRDYGRRLIFGGLIGVSVVAVIELINTTVWDRSLRLALYFFAASIPILAMSIVVDTLKSHFKYSVTPAYMFYANLSGITLTLIGLTALFWHLSSLSAVIFFISSISALAITITYHRLLRTVNEESNEK
jgi:carbon starvation protein CstA